jgi:hypothetical protein
VDRAGPRIARALPVGFPSQRFPKFRLKPRPALYIRHRGNLSQSDTHIRLCSFSARDKPYPSISPKILEPRWCQLAVAHCVLDVLVAEVGLQRPGVHSVVGELETTGMTQHVWVGLYL